MDKLNVGVNGKKLGMVCMVLLCIFGSSLAQAAGVDTANSSLTSMKTWLDTWIPLACAVVLAVLCILWWAHVVRADFATRGALAMIGAGSASYIVSFFFS